MKLQFPKQVRRSLLLGSAAIPVVAVAVIFQNCSRVQLNTTAAIVEPVVNAKSMVGPCKDSSILGVWFSMWSPSGDVFAFTPDCKGSSSHCDSEFQYSKTGSGLTGQLSMRVSKTKSMPGCPTVGDHVCEYEISVIEKRMHFRCDSTQWAEFDMFSPIDGGAVKSPPPPGPQPPVQVVVAPPVPPPPPPTVAAVPPTPPPLAPKVVTKPVAKTPVKPIVAKVPGKPATIVSGAAPNAAVETAAGPVANRAPAAVSPATSAGTAKRIYVSTSPFSGNLGGISGADMKCNSDPNRPAGIATAKALLSDGFNRVACANPLCDEGVEGQADWPLKPGTTYRDAEGNLIGTTNSYAIFSGPMSATAAFSSVKAWTGIKSDWTSSSEHCSGWGQAAKASGMFGSPVANGSFAAGAGSRQCDSGGFRLICVEQ